VAGAPWASLALVPAGGWRWTVHGFLRFAPYFIVQSVRGGADVARRAFSRGPDLRPGYVDFRYTLPPGAPRVFMLGTMSLLPGTLSTRLRGDVLRVHVLDVEWPMEARLRELEARVAELYGARA
jgi:multicomponent Na+:H+ antiporter subunit E